MYERLLKHKHHFVSFEIYINSNINYNINYNINTNHTNTHRENRLKTHQKQAVMTNILDISENFKFFIPILMPQLKLLA